ncbi:MAG: septal ring lytic transglycosylase RlpA family protein [Ancalomicrobiaceae bacterium]|nr:septal ring lytic transglycosylase RlpA family protein [Ancalomicrobiaceae bacterium]
MPQTRRALIASFGLGLMAMGTGSAMAHSAHHSHARPARRSVPAPSGNPMEGLASFYGAEHHGGPTASGERFDMHGMTGAHRTLPLGAQVKVTNLLNGRSVVVRINDRGPFVRGRILDVSRSAAAELDFIARGVTRVRIERV